MALAEEQLTCDFCTTSFSQVGCGAGDKFMKEVHLLGGKNFYVGVFSDKKEAALAYNKKAKELFGEFAYQNPV